MLPFDARAFFEADHKNNLATMDRNKGTYLHKAVIMSLEECSSTWSCPVFLSEVVFGDFSEYVITRRHIKTGKYLSILYDENLCSSLMHFFLCTNYYITDDMYDCLADIMEGVKRTAARMKQSRGESCNSSESPPSLVSYKKMCQVFISSNKPEHIFVLCFFTLEWYLMDWADNCVVHMLIILIGVITVLSFIFPIRRETRKG